MLSMQQLADQLNRELPECRPPHAFGTGPFADIGSLTRALRYSRVIPQSNAGQSMGIAWPCSEEQNDRSESPPSTTVIR
jgi:hypothetical protein